MSDFLSNFDKKNYQKTLEEKKELKNKIEPEPKNHLETSEVVTDDLKTSNEKNTAVAPTMIRKRRKRKKSSPKLEEEITEDIHSKEADTIISTKVYQNPPTQVEEETTDDDVVIDSTYKNKQLKKRLIYGGIVFIILIIFYLVYFQMTRVVVPNFTNESIVEAKSWSSENKMKTESKSEFSLEVDPNNVISQSVPAGKKLKKGSVISFIVSEGADPTQALPLPDFKKMSEEEARQWIEKEQADNASIITEYNDKIEKGQYIKTEFTNKEVTADNYKRQDIMNVYYSKGKEVFEKNISVPDFIKKPKSDVEEWAKQNDMKITYKDIDSDKIEIGSVVSQSIKKGEKVSKQTKMEVGISIGKASIVPNFANYSPSEAPNVDSNLQVTVKEVFSNDVSYGNLISQSVSADTKLVGETKEMITVTYSIGKPYIKSYFGQQEGDLPKLIYDDFNSKGACITYEVYYVTSDSEKGEVVDMNVYNQYIPIDTHLIFSISDGSKAPKPGPSPEAPDEDTDISN